MVNIVCLGNEFMKGDSLAFEIGVILKGEGLEVSHIKNSFELMSIVSSNKDFVILDVVEGLSDVVRLGVSDLRVDSILSAHDMDAGFVLSLLDEDVKIIGIPKEGDISKIKEKVLSLLKN